MKKLIAVLTLAMLCSTVHAYERYGNPDKKISFGFTFDRTAVTGDYELGNFRLTDAGTVRQNNYKADVRVPLFSWLTLTAGYGYTQESMGLFILSRDERWNMTGYNAMAGFRIYLP